MHCSHIAFPLSCCIFCTNCRFRSAMIADNEETPDRDQSLLERSHSTGDSPGHRCLFFGSYRKGKCLVPQNNTRSKFPSDTRLVLRASRKTLAEPKRKR